MSHLNLSNVYYVRLLRDETPVCEIMVQQYCVVSVACIFCSSVFPCHHCLATSEMWCWSGGRRKENMKYW